MKGVEEEREAQCAQSVIEIGVNFAGAAVMSSIAIERERSIQGGICDRSAVCTELCRNVFVWSVSARSEVWRKV